MYQSRESGKPKEQSAKACFEARMTHFDARLNRTRVIAKPLDRKRFGVVTVSVAQLSYLLSDIDWRIPPEVRRPQVAG